MAASPKFKVYDKAGAYQGCAKEVEAAAVLAGFYGEGSTVRLDHGAAYVLWTDGEKLGASYDEIAAIAAARELASHQRSMARVYRAA
jgi:hypothetical protein